jgi:D-apiose dehydrogenase
MSRGMNTAWMKRSEKMSQYRIGIVGCGGIARRHIEGYRTVLGDLGEVVAGCDPNEEQLNGFCDMYDVRLRFRNAAALIASGEVDIISLLTPPAVRGEVIFPAIEHGIHLLIEKPFGETLQDAVSYVEAAEKASTMLAVNHQLGFMDDYQAMQQIVASGDIGEVRFVSHDQFQRRIQVRGWRSCEKRLEISIFSIHLIDRIRTLVGSPPARVSAVTRAWNPNVQGETFTALTVQFESGAVGTMVSNWHALTSPECRLRVDGTNGSMLSIKTAVVADEAKLRVELVDSEVQERDCSRENAFTVAMGESMRQLLRAAKEGVSPPHSGRGNLLTMQIVDAAYLSAERDGKIVEIEEILEG